MFISLDLETTGFDPSTDKIIEFGAIKFDLKGHRESLRFFTDPGIILPQIITHITSITDGDLKNTQPFSARLEEVKNFIGDLPIIGHNIKFDIGFLKTNGLELNNLSYDTQELSSILLPNLPSYSLEILSERLQLKHHEKHRALDDAIAAMELFIKLLKEFERLEPELIKQIQELCERSDWMTKNLLKKLRSKNLKIADTKDKNLQDEDVKRHKINESSPGLESEFFQKILNRSTPAIFELIPPYDNLIKYLGEHAPADSHISLPYHLFRQIHSQIPDQIAKIDVATNYLSLQRLTEFSQKSFFENHELTALLKYLIWSKRTKTGLLSEVALFNEERKTLNKINIDENIPDPKEEHFFKLALEKEKNTTTVCTHQYLAENPVTNKKLIIIDFENFIYSIHRNLSIYVKLEPALSILKSLQELSPDNKTIETLMAKITILFGLFGIIFEKYNDRNVFAARSTINEDMLQTKEWLDAQKSLNNLIEISRELGEVKNEKTFGYLQQWKGTLKNLHGILAASGTEQDFIWLERDPQANIILRKAPHSHKENLGKILENSTNYQIIDECVDLQDNGDFIRSFSGLKADLPIIKPKSGTENMQIFIIKDTDGSDKNKVPNFIQEYYKNKSRNIAYIFNSKKDLELTTLQLGEFDLPVLPQLAGSLGKIQEMFLNQKKAGISPILLLTPYVWKNFGHQSGIDTLIIHKIPFEPPSDPLLLAMSKNYANPFMELAMPRAMIELIKIINRIKKDQRNPKNVIILDPRLTNRQYGDIIMNILNALAPTSTTRLNQLL